MIKSRNCAALQAKVSFRFYSIGMWCAGKMTAADLADDLLYVADLIAIYQRDRRGYRARFGKDPF